MGIRVHKMLGYGLADVKTKDGELDDPRINLDGIVNYNAIEDYDDRWPKKKYLQWLVNRDQELPPDKKYHASAEYITVKKQASRWDPTDSFIWQSEFGMPNVLCIIPGGHYKQWYRYDDTIDYYDETNPLNPDGQINRVQYVRGGIHPYNGLYFDSRTGEDVRGMAMDLEGKEPIAPRVPECVKYLCKFGQAFTDPTVVWQLRPILYVYWG